MNHEPRHDSPCAASTGSSRRRSATALLGLFALGAIGGGAAAQVAPAAPPATATTAGPPVPRIVNGVDTQDYPTAAALLDRQSGLQLCSAVLVGCRTVLTAAHCVCSGTGAECQAGVGKAGPEDLEIFLPHAGFFEVEAVTVSPLFDFGIRDDIAVLRLATEVEGIQPSRLNSVERLGAGSPATIVGFGLSTEDIFDNGIKREGGIVTGTCSVVPADEYICWDFDEPLGPPGTDANTCSGDSGGPLFADFGSGPLVAGIGSGGVAPDCEADDLPFDADVFANLSLLAAAAGDDLGAAECGELPVVGSPAATEIDQSGTFSQGEQPIDHTFQVPAGALSLRVGLNAEEGLLFNEVDLTVSSGGAPPVGQVQCTSTRDGTYEYCEIAAPAAGTWNARVVPSSGAGDYQLTTTILREVDLGPCVPDPTTLCIDDAPDDGRFEATIAFDTSQASGRAGLGTVVDLDQVGIDAGGVFWFFDPKNPEVLLKVLNGCGVNGHYWVFWSAGTNVRMVVSVTDRRTGRQRVYPNPDLNPALPVTDILAFSC